MKYKKRIYILIFTIVFYLIFNFVYENIINTNDFLKVYILSQDVQRGEVITKDIIKSVKILNKENVFDPKIYILNNEIEGIVSNDSFKKGQILLKDMFILKEDFVDVEDDKELISINIDKTDDNLSNQVRTGNIVNIYYTGKSSQVGELLNKFNFESVISDLKNDSYSTIKIIENTKVINVFDKNGNQIKNNIKDINNLSENKNEIDTIMIKTTKEKVMLINNLKKYGTFSLSIKK